MNNKGRLPISFLYTGIVLKIISVFLVVVSVNQLDEGSFTYTFNSELDYWFGIILVTVLLPIIEEFAFDGLFLKNKIFKVTGVLLLIACSIYISFSIIHLFLLIVFLGIMCYYKRNKNNLVLYLAVVVNAALFSSYHFDFNNLEVDWYWSFLSRFAGGLISLWLLLNYNLFFAILEHIVWNSILTIYALYPFNLDQPGGVCTTLVADEFKIEYAETALISKEELKFEEDFIYCNSCKFEDFYEFYDYFDKKTITQIKKDEIYDIYITVKDSSLNDDRTKLLDLLLVELEKKQILKVEP
ncbi:MAG: hypothetical protein ACQESK_10220 [Bacteroidota bacterium]